LDFTASPSSTSLPCNSSGRIRSSPRRSSEMLP
jgi:hypothetical protein